MMELFICGVIWLAMTGFTLGYEEHRKAGDLALAFLLAPIGFGWALGEIARDFTSSEDPKP